MRPDVSACAEDAVAISVPPPRIQAASAATAKAKISLARRESGVDLGSVIMKNAKTNSAPDCI